MGERTPGHEPILALLVDDHPLVRGGLAQLLAEERDLEVCGEASTGREALDLAASLQPDLVIVDLALPDVSGIELIRDLKSRHPHITILALSMHDEEIYAERALRAGASGYVMKGQPPQEVIAALRRVLGGGLYVSEAMAAAMVERTVRPGRADAPSPVASLTDRELEVLTLVGEGLAPREIAAKLHLSVHTVETHRSHIREKLDLPDAAALRRFAVRWMRGQQRQS
jgi:DNA-binding NarL/FixJ family response regulator